MGASLRVRDGLEALAPDGLTVSVGAGRFYVQPQVFIESVQP